MGGRHYENEMMKDKLGTKESRRQSEWPSYLIKFSKILRIRLNLYLRLVPYGVKTLAF